MSRASRLILLVVLAVGMVVSGASFALWRDTDDPAHFKSLPFHNGAEYVKGEFIVKLAQREIAPLSALRELFTPIHLLQMKKISDSAPLFLIRVGKEISAGEMLRLFKSNSRIEYIEPNYIYRIDTFHPTPLLLSNDPGFAFNWGLSNIGQTVANLIGLVGSDIDAVRAWDVTTGSRSMIVGVIDTGVDANHPDLKENMWVNVNEVPNNGVDDDSNGFIDDVAGWNFYANNNNSFDDNGHGTHVSGTIGAIGNNGIGTVGVNWQVTIMPLKFLGADGSGTTDGAIQAVNYAVKMGAKVLSNSWGGGGFSQGLSDAITAAEAKNIIFVAAAGNNGTDNDFSSHYPSNYPHQNVIAVAATDCRDQLASFSNYGIRSVDLSAPGVTIYSTLPNNTYGSYSGTSMATPHVSGAVALLWSFNPSFTMGEVIQRILVSSDEVLSTKRKIASSGRLNIFNALTGVVAPRTPAVDPSVWTLVPQSISTPHDYTNNYTQSWTIQHPGAKALAVHFSNFSTEGGYDRVTIADATGIIYDTLDGAIGQIWSLPVSGDTVVVTFRADSSITGFGFDIDQYAAQPADSGIETDR